MMKKDIGMSQVLRQTMAEAKKHKAVFDEAEDTGVNLVGADSNT